MVKVLLFGVVVFESDGVVYCMFDVIDDVFFNLVVGGIRVDYNIVVYCVLYFFDLGGVVLYFYIYYLCYVVVVVVVG